MSIFDTNISLFSRVSFLDRLLFTKHLSIMLTSGITIAEALEALAAQTKSAVFNKVLTDILKKVENGESLSKALAAHPKVFNTFYISIIEVGEEAGELEKNLEFLAGQLEKDYALRKKIQGAMLYPAIVLSTSTVIGVGLSLFVMPKLIDLFQSLDVKLPVTTQILLFFANTMKNYGILVVAGFFGVLFLFKLLTQLPAVKPLWHRFLLIIPIIGPFIEYSALSEMFRNLGIMIKSGLSITRALDIQHEVTENLVFKEYIKVLQKEVQKGKGIEEELETKHFSKIPALATKMIGVGEKTGKLDETLIYLGNFYDDEVDNIAKNLSTTLEPILLLGIGLIVAFVALAIISPIYQLTGSIKR